MVITLVQLREQHELTQAELASMLGVARRTVGMWETGERTPGLHTAKQVASLFGVHVEDIAFCAVKKDTSERIA